MDRMSAIARAVLYEGYLLWPYRRSALKNSHRWTFGAVFPPHWSSEHPDDPCLMQSEVLLEGDADTRLEATVRFLHVIDRGLTDAQGRPVDQLQLDGERHLAWEEATERELGFASRPLGELEDGQQTLLLLDAGSEQERLTAAKHGDTGTLTAAKYRDAGTPMAAEPCDRGPLTGAEPRDAGTLTRSWSVLAVHASIRAQRLESGLYRLTVRVRNATSWQGKERQQALRHALLSTHVAWQAQDGAFVSAADPPARLEAHVRACTNVGTWPVLAGAPGDRSAMLSAPIILEDHPRIAPESPGDMFDGGEIDQLLILNVLALSEEEKREMRDSDPRARAILERCCDMGAEELTGLHGAIRELRPLEGT